MELGLAAGATFEGARHVMRDVQKHVTVTRAGSRTPNLACRLHAAETTSRCPLRLRRLLLAHWGTHLLDVLLITLEPVRRGLDRVVDLVDRELVTRDVYCQNCTCV